MVKKKSVVFVGRFENVQNGCYTLGWFVKSVGVDNQTGKIMVRNLSYNEFRKMNGHNIMYYHEDEKIKVIGRGYKDYNLYDIEIVE